MHQRDFTVSAMVSITFMRNQNTSCIFLKGYVNLTHLYCSYHLARRHGPKGTWRDHARIPIWIFQGSHYYWFVGKRNWCPTSLPCNQLWPSNQSRKLHSQVTFFIEIRTTITKFQKLSHKIFSSNIYMFITELVVVDDSAEKELQSTS